MSVIYVLDPIHPDGVAILRARASTLVLWDDPRKENWREEAEGIIVRMPTKLTPDEFARAKKLKAVSKHGIGVENIDLDAARAHGIPVMNTHGVNAEAVAEFAFGLAHVLARRVAMADRWLRQGRKVAREDFDGRGFEGKTVGIIGMGNIGRRLAPKWHRAYDMTVLGYDPHLPEPAWTDLDVPVERCTDVDGLLARADLVSVHVPLTEETRALIGVQALQTMKPTAMLISAARGGVVDEAALFNALKDGTIWGAALDVFDEEPPKANHPLYTLETFVGTPHLAGAAEDSRARCAVMCAEQVLDAVEKGETRNVVN